MKVEINVRGNGACPLCRFSGKCRLQDTISKSIIDFTQMDNPIELVVYSCPKFREKLEHE